GDDLVPAQDDVRGGLLLSGACQRMDLGSHRMVGGPPPRIAVDSAVSGSRPAKSRRRALLTHRRAEPRLLIGKGPHLEGRAGAAAPPVRAGTPPRACKPPAAPGRPGAEAMAHRAEPQPGPQATVGSAVSAG